MNSDSLEMSVGETSAQRYRNRSRELLEAAGKMASGETRQDLEWVARRYEAMASSAERIEALRMPTPALRLR
jgi:hypothetical protein